MAGMTVDGLDGLMDDFAALAALPDQVAEDMLNAEADVLVKAQRAEIKSRWRGPYSQGISAKSVKKGKVKPSGIGHSISVYPQGTRTRGKQRVRNAEIAFINEYGKTGQPARPAINTANKKKEQEAVEAAEKVYHAYLDSKNL